ncbi:MAG: DUF4412 domain-containing protein [bacterium]
MKFFIKSSLALALVLGWGIGLSWAGEFQGEVDYHVTMSDGHKSQMNYFLKGSKARMEMTMDGHHVVNIIDFPAKKIYMLMPEQKIVMTTAIPDVKKEQSKTGEKMKKTGKTKKILGRETYEWKSTDKNGTTSIWGAKGMGAFMMGAGPGGKGPDTSWTAAVEKAGLFPLEMDSKEKKDGMSMIATKIESKHLDNSLFKVPSDYKDMSAMMQGMAAGAMPHF